MDWKSAPRATNSSLRDRYQQLKNFAKLTLKGEEVWEKRAPMDSGIYPKGEDTKPTKRWAATRLCQRNYAFLRTVDFTCGWLRRVPGPSLRQGRELEVTVWTPGKEDGQFNTRTGSGLMIAPGVKRQSSSPTRE